MPIGWTLGFIGATQGGSSATSSASVTASLTAIFLDSDAATNNSSLYTFSGLNFGTAAGNRLLVASVHSRNNSIDAQPPDTVTIGGVAATRVVTRSDNVVSCSIWQALVPSGTSGSVVLDWDGDGQNRCAIGLWSIKTNNQAAQHSGSSIGGGSIAATVPTSGYGIAAYVGDSGGSSGTVTPTNYTEDFDTGNIEEGTTAEGGHFTASATIDATPSVSMGSGETLVYASWGP